MTSDELLRELVEQILSEKIRSKSFELSTFKKLPFKLLEEYAESTGLKFLGQGTSRVAFLLSSGKALKIALNDAGLGQNEAEIDVYTNPKTKDIVTKIFDYHSKMWWIISELAKPLRSYGEFKEICGLDLDSTMVTDALFLSKNIESDEHRKNLFSRKKRTPEQQKLAQEIASLLAYGNILYGDLMKYNSWGTTASGRLVVLDYGCTKSVLNQFYLG